jgi:hypothetical protein
VGDLERCHAGAAAAVHAIESGQPLAVVTENAGKVAHGAHSIAAPADAGTRVYANWFAWSNLEQKLDRERSHLAAEAATTAQNQGLAVADAAAAGLRAAGVAPAQLPQPVAAAGRFASVRNGALLNLAWGVACLIVPFVFSFYFPIAPVIGLIWGARVLRVSRHPLVLAAIAVNVLALLLNIFILTHSRH